MKKGKFKLNVLFKNTSERTVGQPSGQSRDAAVYQRFSFLTAITGLTSVVLLGMTVGVSGRDLAQDFRYKNSTDIHVAIDNVLRVVAFIMSFLSAVFVRFQLRRRLYACWIYALFSLVLSSILCFGVLLRVLNISWDRSG